MIDSRPSIWLQWLLKYKVSIDMWTKAKAMVFNFPCVPIDFFLQSKEA